MRRHKVGLSALLAEGKKKGARSPTSHRVPWMWDFSREGRPQPNPLGTMPIHITCISLAPSIQSLFTRGPLGWRHVEDCNTPDTRGRAAMIEILI